jgi:hypothetical protein
METLMSATMVFRVVTPYSSDRASRFGGTYRLHLQGRRVSQVRPTPAVRFSLLLAWPTLQPWRLRRYGPPKREALSELYGVTTQNTVLFITIIDKQNKYTIVTFGVCIFVMSILVFDSQHFEPLDTLTVTQLLEKYSTPLWNLKVLYRVDTSPSLAHILSQMNPAHNLAPCFFKIHYDMTPTDACVSQLIHFCGDWMRPSNLHNYCTQTAHGTTVPCTKHAVDIVYIHKFDLEHFSM